LLFLFYAWALLDRRVYRTTKTPQELVKGLIVDTRAVDEAQAHGRRIGVEESAEAFREQHEQRRLKDS
jgi:hypothetical protein